MRSDMPMEWQQTRAESPSGVALTDSESKAFYFGSELAVLYSSPVSGGWLCDLMEMLGYK
jgi:hypothetical protein